MKKLSKLLFILFIVLSTTLINGCTYGSGTTSMSVEVNTGSKMSMSYKKFTGYKATKLSVEKDQTVEVEVDIVSEAGKLDLVIEKENKGDDEGEQEKKGKPEKVYEGTDIPTSNFKVILEEPGKYIVKVTGDKHKGSYKITWEEHDKKK